jgi:hypothetical protein
VCSDISLFSSYQIARDSSVMIGNGSHASIRGGGMVDLKLTSRQIVQLNGSHASIRGGGMVDLKLTLRQIVQLKNVQHVPSINKNLVSDSLLCRDGFKTVLESNKFVILKCGQFIGKFYVCGGLFCFSISDSVISL